MKRFLFLFGMLAISLLMFASEVQTVDYETDVGITQMYTTSDQVFSAGAVTDVQEFVLSNPYQITQDYAFVAQVTNDFQEYWEYVSTDRNYSHESRLLERAYSINAPPNAMNAIIAVNSDFEQVLKDYLKKSNLMDIEDSVQSDNEQLAEYGVIDLHNPDLFDKGEWDDTYIVCKAKKDLHTNEWNPANPDDFVFSSDNPKEHPLYEGFTDQDFGVVNIKAGNYFLIAPQDGYVVDLGETEDDAITMLHLI